jgi:hypothetical protein
MTNENETETEFKPEIELKTPKSIALATKFISMMEKRAKRSSDAASNHELISKLTFLIVLGMAYENWGDRIMSALALFV